MRPAPPIRPRPTRSSRRAASGRPAVVPLVALAILTLAACVTPPAPSSSPSGSPWAEATAGSPTSPSPSAAAPSSDGLLVAAAGALQITANGVLVPFDGPPGTSVEVVAARGVVIVVDEAGGLLRSERPAAGARSWRPLTPAPRPGENPRLLSLSPTGTTLALADGALQARSFRLTLVDLGDGATRSIDVARGLDGPPIWVGPAIVAVHAIRDDQTSGFTVVDLTTGAVTDVPSYGIAVAATADGTRVAIDVATTGEVLVGERSAVNDAGIAQMARLAIPPGRGGVERIALNGDGTRLAITRRTESGTTIELHVLVDGTWRAAGSIAIPGDRTVSIAWLDAGQP
jgi:hypothetical protein